MLDACHHTDHKLSVPSLTEIRSLRNARRKAIPALAGIAAAGAVLCMPLHANAHPHVWVSAEAEVIYAKDASITGIRYRWSFDEAYSAFAVQGLDKDNDGILTPDELAELAKTNIESLVDFGYFTTAKANGAKQAFGQPVDYALDYTSKLLTLTFTLPLKAPTRAQKSFGLEVFDDSYFVSFAWSDKPDAVRLRDAPQGCLVNMTRPKGDAAPAAGATPPKLTEEFFASGSAANFGAQFANKALVTCP
jgi:ABC-type uncharacterized transport system substrate-binding protein